MIEVREVLDQNVKERICEDILNQLPDWFGVPSAILEFKEKCKSMPFFAAYEEEEPVGFIALERHNEYTIEIYVMGIKANYHRKGIGRHLMNKSIEYAINHQFKLFEVKTLDESNPDPYYAKTRNFYKAMGFLPLQCFPDYWDQANPCLVMVKPL